MLHCPFLPPSLPPSFLLRHVQTMCRMHGEEVDEEGEVEGELEGA
jgi:hypothetical protein